MSGEYELTPGPQREEIARLVLAMMREQAESGGEVRRNYGNVELVVVPTADPYKLGFEIVNASDNQLPVLDQPVRFEEGQMVFAWAEGSWASLEKARHEAEDQAFLAAVDRLLVDLPTRKGYKERAESNQPWYSRFRRKTKRK